MDIAKAFDMVSHSHITTDLRQKHMDEHIIILIKDLYYNITTCIALKNEQSDHIGIQVGVK